MVPSLCEVIKREARILEEDCERSATRDTLLAASWHRTNLFLGISAAIVAALAAFLFGKGELWYHSTWGQHVATTAALLAAILTSTLTFLAPSEKAGAYHHFANKLRALRDRTRSFIEIDCIQAGLKGAELSRKFERMLREKSEIESSHPVVPYWVYEKSYVEMKRKLEFKLALRKARLQIEGTEGRNLFSNELMVETLARNVESGTQQIVDVRFAPGEDVAHLHRSPGPAAGRLNTALR
jgi:hypothetical protein